ncbi:MAG: pyridoxamine 5-phosphate oxidase [Mycobacterium sp.]|nr:pyridoxamine 5-phosphate oxidase [Mycobacterium sp.]
MRSLPVFAGVMRDFDPAVTPEHPAALFTRWLREAVEDGVPEPHAMTLSTCDEAGLPDARVLILKDLDDEGWWFATNANSAKGIQMAAVPAAALTFYWPQVGRQIRVRGSVVAGSAERSAADFRARGSGARAVALASHEGEPLADVETCARAVVAAERRLAEDPGLIAPGWQAYVLTPSVVEFWQADKDRRHVRLQYCLDEDRWTHTLLWP